MSIGTYRSRKVSERSARARGLWQTVIALMLLAPLFAMLGGQSARAQDEAGPLRIGTLFPFTGDLSDFGANFKNAADLAVTEINAGGGVNGQPVELVQGDTATSPQQAVEEARRLIEIEGVPAIVGPAGSGEALPVVESVSGPAGVLTISPSATSPALTVANDDDFFFRTTISDAAQGVVMADVAKEQGYQTVCILYVNNAYGQGLNDAFAERFTAEGGEVQAQVPVEQEQASYASEISTCTAGDPDAMIAVAYPESGRIFLRELVEAGNPPSLVFSDGLKSPEMFAELGWEAFTGSYGTAAGALETEAGTTFEQAWADAYGGELPSLPYLREVYDAIYLISLAAEQADSVDGAAIRDALRDIAGPPGERVGPGTEGWQAAVAAISNGEDVDYEGAVGPIDFDENGDVSKGAIVVWKIEGEEIVDQESRNVDLSAAGEAATPMATPAA